MMSQLRSAPNLLTLLRLIFIPFVIIAVQQRNLPVVRVLLNQNANPDKTDSAAGYSARDYATRDPRARKILKMIDDKKPKAAAAAAK